MRAVQLPQFPTFLLLLFSLKGNCPENLAHNREIWYDKNIKTRSIKV